MQATHTQLFMQTLSDADRPRINKRLEAISKEAQRFERVVVSRDEALGMFQENKFKIEIISSLPADATITLYRVGPMVDLCTGPHLPNTSYIKVV
jgi:threonyl-tRNA synthetase